MVPSHTSSSLTSSWTQFRYNRTTKIVDFNLRYKMLTSEKLQELFWKTYSCRLSCSIRGFEFVCICTKWLYFRHFSLVPMRAGRHLFTALQCWGFLPGLWLIWAFVYSGTEWHQTRCHILLSQGEWASVAMPSSFVQPPLPPLPFLCPPRPYLSVTSVFFVTLHRE